MTTSPTQNTNIQMPPATASRADFISKSGSGIGPSSPLAAAGVMGVHIGAPLTNEEVSSGVRGVTLRMFFILVIIGIGIGLVMGSVVWFRSHEGQFQTLYWKNLALQEAVFTERTARSNKDMILMQEQARQEQAFADDVQARITEQTYIDVTLQEDIQQRTINDQNISDLLDNETAARIAGDQSLQERIDNATADLNVIKAFQNYSADKFMVIMQNVTDLQTALQQEIDDRIATIMYIMSQRTIVDTALVNLVNAVNQEIQDRIDKDGNLTVLINLATHGIIRSINDQQPINYIMYLVSTNDLFLTITNGTSNEIVINNLGIYSFNGTVHSDNATHLLFFTADHGFGITDDPLNHEMTIFSTFAEGGQLPNFVRLSATIPYGTDVAGLVPYYNRLQPGNTPGMFGPQIDDPSSFPLGNGVLLAHPLTNPAKGIFVYPGSSTVKLRYGSPGICSANHSPCQCAGGGCPASAFFGTFPSQWQCQDTPAGNKCTTWCSMFNTITFQDLSLFGTIQCASAYGFGWYCAFTSTSPFGYGECLTAGFSLACSGGICENNGHLGDQWGCLPNSISPGAFTCDQIYCYYDADCTDRFDVGGYRHFCVNGRCVPSSRFNGDSYPTAITGPISSYNGQGYPYPLGSTYVAAYPGYASAAMSLNAVYSIYNYDGIIHNKPLFTIAGGWPYNVNLACTESYQCPTYAVCDGGTCKRGYFPNWDNQNHGFRIPMSAENSTWAIKVTVTIRVLFSQQHVNQNSFIALYIDRGLGWEKQDETFVGLNNGGYTISGPLGFPSFFNNAFFYSPYVSLSTVVIMSTMGDKATPPGTPLYVGWSTNTFWLCPITVSGQGCTFQPYMSAESLWIPWYRITYDVTKLA